MKRVFLIVLDSFGIGALPDADRYGDIGANTIKSCFNTGKLNIPNMLKMGLGNIEGNSFLGPVLSPDSAYGKLSELSVGKDTTTGHWEIAGLISDKPFPTYPYGFPKEILDEFSKQTGRGVLCNKTYSGTEVIRDYGEQHIKTGDLIVYTSADSVFQIAAHEEIIPVDTLYEYCKIARKILSGKHAVGRVIARPFITKNGSFVRTSNRHDFSLEPSGETMLDKIKNKCQSVLAVGKISDIFAGKGITEAFFTHSNDEGMTITENIASKNFNGLCFTNLVDFDTLYGHRNDAIGYTNALNQFDKWLGMFKNKLKNDDILIITSDHGCDPNFTGTDHTREYTPLLIYGKGITPENLGVNEGFNFISKFICEYLNV